MMGTWGTKAAGGPEEVGATRALRLYLFSALIDTIGGGLWMPVSLIFFINAKHFTPEQTGFALTAGGVVGLLIGPVGGSLIDRWGPAFFVITGNLLSAAVFALFTFVDSIWQVGLLGAVFAAADRLFWTANAPLLGQLVAGRKLDRIIGYQNVVRIIGLGVGAGLSGLLIGNEKGLIALAYANSISYVLTAGMVLIAVRLARSTWNAAGVGGAASEQAPKAAWGTVMTDWPYLLLCLVQVQFGLAARSLVVILPLVAIDRLGGPTWLPGVSIVVGNALLAVIQTPAVRLSERTTRLRMLNMAGIVFGLAFLVLAPAETLGHTWAIPTILLASVLGAIAEALFGPLTIAAANQAAPEGHKGRYSAVFQTAWGVANVLAPAVLTALLAVSNSVLWLTMSAIILLAVPVTTLAARRLPAGCLR